MELKPYSREQLQEMYVLKNQKYVRDTIQTTVSRIHSQILNETRLGRRSYIWTNPGVPLYMTIRVMTHIQSLFPDSNVTRIGSNIKIEWI